MIPDAIHVQGGRVIPLHDKPGLDFQMRSSSTLFQEAQGALGSTQLLPTSHNLEHDCDKQAAVASMHTASSTLYAVPKLVLLPCRQ